MVVHEGAGVLPGRYPGEPIRLHDGPTPQQQEHAATRQAADVLAGRIGAAAALSAQSECTLLELIGEFDATNSLRFWTDVKSLAHWLAWCCSMNLGVAREHVRVARALRRMPTITDAFRAGRLSYSKVREVTRVVDVVDEARLGELAQTATAAQLAVMISAFRSADGRRIGQQTQRQVTITEREDGMVEIKARLPKEEAAVLIAAMETSRDQFGPPPAKSSAVSQADAEAETAATPAYSRADALVDVARAFLNTAPEDRSGEDRHLVVVHVDADLLSDPPAVDADPKDVPAGTSQTRGAVCHIDGVGPVEPATAARLACDATLLGAITGDGAVLHLGRTRRLVSRAQRRALTIRDRMCRYPGCAQTRHLDAHHVIGWAAGGSTDLDNLILLCRFHHTAVHEGGVTITQTPDGWQFILPDGSEPRPRQAGDTLADLLAAQARRTTAAIEGVDRFDHPTARTIRPRWVGEPFSVHDCVQALFSIRLPETTPQHQDQQQAA
jgi:hypothetical protein